MSARRRLHRYGLGAVRAIAAAAFSFPLYWMLVTATGPRGAAYRFPPRILPGLDFHSFVTVIDGSNWARYMLNSTFITATTIVLVLFTSALAGWALVALPLGLRGAVFIVLLGTMLLPEQALIIPQYVVNFHLHLLNTYAVMIVPFAATSSSIFLFRQYFATMPAEWRDAARVEGLGNLRYLWRVAFPAAKPVVFTVILLTFIASWNQFQWPLIMTQNPSIAPIELALNQYQSAYEASQRLINAVSLLALLPIVAVFAVAQRHIVGAVGGLDTGVEG
ncbi:MAG: carbohydrate ABC transporter permease [Actinomycetota bacterium]|nr:carbohydrate ABC transporter permease [Actinomycetota bacterium]